MVLFKAKSQAGAKAKFLVIANGAGNTRDEKFDKVRETEQARRAPNPPAVSAGPPKRPRHLSRSRAFILKTAESGADELAQNPAILRPRAAARPGAGLDRLGAGRPAAHPKVGRKPLPRRSMAAGVRTFLGSRRASSRW
ncbi:MAG: hypothetical protein LBE85_10190 [Candidatus Accumulibacter sp.]|jgi:hypothetical protein|nr:hypothetical protein [Accumulibacter sp.]